MLRTLTAKVYPAEPASASSEEFSSQEDSDGDVPFEQLQLNRGNAGVTAIRPTSKASKTKPGSRNSSVVPSKADTDTRRDAPVSFKRANKNRPAELSSKKPVPRFREVIEGPKREARDPRFDNPLKTPVNTDTFYKRYAFLFDEQLPSERQELKNALKKVKSGSRKEELAERLGAVEAQLKAERERRKKEKRAEERKSKEREAVRGGKKPFYLKKSELRKQELLDKYQDLKVTGQLDKFLAKRRKRTAAKDHRLLPSKRRKGDE